VSAKLSELASNLCHAGNANGTWLSSVRNDITYKQSFGTWYPYRVHAFGGTFEHRLIPNWQEDPMAINLASHGDKNFRRFQETCSFIIATCRTIATDMAERCPKGRSFHTYGWLAISRLAQQRISSKDQRGHF
jgi:hypothetical protein